MAPSSAASPATPAPPGSGRRRAAGRRAPPARARGGRRVFSLPTLHPWPPLRQGTVRAAADVDVEVLIGHRVRVTDVPGQLDVIEELLQGLPVVVQHDHHVTSVAARTP